MNCFKVLLLACVLGCGTEQNRVEDKNKVRHFVQVLNQPLKQLKSGTADTLSVLIQVEEGYHIQSNRPNNDNLIASVISIRDSLPFIESWADIIYPADKDMLLNGTDLIRVYDGLVKFEIPCVVAKDANAGSHVVSGEIRYQACDHDSCFFPRKLAFEIAIHIRD